MAHAQPDANVYYVPHQSRWPFVGSIVMFTMMVGVANWFNGSDWGFNVFMVGLLGMLLTLGFWFGDVISESMQEPLQRTSGHFIPHGHDVVHFFEVMFFAPRSSGPCSMP